MTHAYCARGAGPFFSMTQQVLEAVRSASTFSSRQMQ